MNDEMMQVLLTRIERTEARLALLERGPGIGVAPLVLIQGDELTIAGGVITVTHSYHNVDTEGDGASDDLDTINGGTTGQLLVLRTVTSTRDVTLTESGNIKLGGTSRVLDNSSDRILLIYGGAY